MIMVFRFNKVFFETYLFLKTLSIKGELFLNSKVPYQAVFKYSGLKKSI
jgi:hypothetical protein